MKLDNLDKLAVSNLLQMIRMFRGLKINFKIYETLDVSGFNIRLVSGWQGKEVFCDFTFSEEGSYLGFNGIIGDNIKDVNSWIKEHR